MHVKFRSAPLQFYGAETTGCAGTDYGNNILSFHLYLFFSQTSPILWNCVNELKQVE